MKYNSVALLLGYNQVFFYPEVLDSLPIYFFAYFFISGKPHLFLRTEKKSGGKLMFMQFEIVSICVWLWYFFQKHVVLQLIHICNNNTC